MLCIILNAISYPFVCLWHCLFNGLASINHPKWHIVVESVRIKMAPKIVCWLKWNNNFYARVYSSIEMVIFQSIYINAKLPMPKIFDCKSSQSIWNKNGLLWLELQSFLFDTVQNSIKLIWVNLLQVNFDWFRTFGWSLFFGTGLAGIFRFDLRFFFLVF